MLSEDRDISYRYVFVLRHFPSNISIDDFLRLVVLVEGWSLDPLYLLSIGSLVFDVMTCNVVVTLSLTKIVSSLLSYTTVFIRCCC